MRENVQNILEDNNEVLEAVVDNQKLTEDYNEGITNRLKPKLYELKREGDSKISLASEKCKNTTLSITMDSSFLAVNLLFFRELKFFQ